MEKTNEATPSKHTAEEFYHMYVKYELEEISDSMKDSIIKAIDAYGHHKLKDAYDSLVAENKQLTEDNEWNLKHAQRLEAENQKLKDDLQKMHDGYDDAIEKSVNITNSLLEAIRQRLEVTMIIAVSNKHVYLEDEINFLQSLITKAKNV